MGTWTAVIQFVKDLGPVIVGVAALVVTAAINMRVLSQRQLESDRTFRLKQNEEERKEIVSKLNSFYGPIRQLLGISGQLYERFTRGRSPEFRTLISLLEGTKFEGNDAVLLEQILLVTAQVRQLIVDKSGMVTDDRLRQTLARAGAHFTILQLAYEQKLRGEVDRFEDIVFPREIRVEIDHEIRKLQERLELLNREEALGLMPASTASATRDASLPTDSTTGPRIPSRA